MTKKKQKDANIRITLEARKRLRILAAQRGISIKELVEKLSLKATNTNKP